MNNFLLKRFLNLSIGPLGSAFINILTIPLITWFISPEEYGKTNFFTVLQTLAIAFTFLGMDQAYLREFNNQKNKKGLLLNSSFLSVILSVIVSLLILIFSVEFHEYRLVMILFAIWLPFVTLERFLLLSLRLNGHELSYSVFTIIIKVLIMLFTLLFLLYWSQSYISVVSASVIGQVMTDVILIYFCRKDIKIKMDLLEKDLLTKMLKFGLPFIPTTIIMWLLNSTDRIILGRFSSFEELGIYFAAFKVVGIFLIFQTIFTTFWLPVAYEWKKDKVDNKEFEKINVLISFIMSLIFVSILTVKELFVYFLSSEYSEIVDILPFLLFFPIMFTLGEATGLGILFSRKTSYNVWISSIVAVLNITLNLLFILYWDMGAKGASFATGITYIFYFWIRTIISRKLWFNFKLSPYILLTLILVLIALSNVYIDTNIVYLNILFLILIVFSNYKILLEIYSYFMKIKKGA